VVTANYKKYLEKKEAVRLYNELTTRFGLKLQGNKRTRVKYPEEASYRLLSTPTLPCADGQVTTTHDLNTASSTGSHMLQSLAKGPHSNEHGTLFTTTALHPHISPLTQQKKARLTITKPNKQPPSSSISTINSSAML
jgi:hypothetical protein